MQTHFRGRAWVFGEDISTDHIIAGRYLGTTDPKVFAEHCLEAVDPNFAKQAKPGDVVVAGANFGCGSSREQAPLAFKHLGIAAILAPSFARIFFRNAINIALPVLECAEIEKAVKAGEEVDIEMKTGEVRTSSGILKFRPLPPNVLEILEAGGLVPKLKRDLAAKIA
jgi:3-isopropylmalate dehydratase small subunit